MSINPKIPLEETSVPNVYAAIATTFRMLDIYDLDALHAAVSDLDGTLPIFHPSLFMKTQADPHWKLKTDLIEAAADYVRKVGALASQLPEVAP